MARSAVDTEAIALGLIGGHVPDGTLAGHRSHDRAHIVGQEFGQTGDHADVEGLLIAVLGEHSQIDGELESVRSAGATGQGERITAVVPRTATQGDGAEGTRGVSHRNIGIGADNQASRDPGSGRDKAVIGQFEE